MRTMYKSRLSQVKLATVLTSAGNIKVNIFGKKDITNKKNVQNVDFKRAPASGDMRWIFISSSRLFHCEERPR